MLTSALRTLVKNLVKENFDIIFMENEKSCQNINCFFFPHKNFLMAFVSISYIYIYNLKFDNYGSY